MAAASQEKFGNAQDPSVASKAWNDKEADETSTQQVGCSRDQRYKLGYALTQFAIGAPFSAFNTYIAYQLQIVGYTIGNEPGQPRGSGCSLLATACEVPFGSKSWVNYVSFNNYINAITYVVTAFLILALSGLADRIGHKREQYVLLVIVYATLALPSAALTRSNHSTFAALTALYILFNTMDFLAGNWGKYIVPFVMFNVESEGLPADQPLNSQAREDLQELSSCRLVRETSGTLASVWGSNALSIGQIIVLVITIGASYASATSAGLYVSTASGIVAFVVVISAWRLLPEAAPRTCASASVGMLLEPVQTVLDLFRGIYKYPQAFKLLVAYTIYADAALVFGGVTSSLFTLNVSRDIRIYTAYSIVQPSSALLAGFFSAWFFPAALRRGIGSCVFGLKSVMLVGLLANLLMTVWCCIGIAGSSSIGFKQPWEFYLWQAVQGISGALINFCFNVLFAQLFPRGREIEYFGFQTVLSCATIWIPQIVNGPIVTATNIVRLPAVVCVAALLGSFGLTFWCDDKAGIRIIEQEAAAATLAKD